VSAVVMKVDGTPTRMYRGVGEVVIGVDRDFEQTVSLTTRSLLAALRELNFIVIDLDDVDA
jgi:hypothetical protein